MSGETIMIIIMAIGAILLLLAVIDGLTSKNLMSNKLRIPLGILGFMLIIFSGYSYGLIDRSTVQMENISVDGQLKVEYPVKKVQVTSPIEGDEVSCRIMTMGVYPDGHNKDIWVLLKPTDDKYYPQSDNTNRSFKLNGRWQVITRFGGDEGEPFDVIVYETDESASKFFSKTIEEWKEANEYVGLTDNQIPDGAKEIDRISVNLKYNCRGIF